MSQATTPKQVLIAAKWLLQNVGWCQGWFQKDAQGDNIYDPEHGNMHQICSMCLTGAVYLVETNNEETREQAQRLLSKIVYESFGYTVPNFNDDPDTTKQDVLRVLNKAIKNAP